MTVAELFQKIGRKKTEAASTAYGRYRLLLIDIVSGVELDSEAAEIVLNEYGKDQLQLETDVETMRQRLTWVKNISDRRQAETEAGNYRNQIEALDREFQIAKQKHAERIAELTPKLQVSEGTIRRCVDAEIRLKNSCMDPSLLSRENELANRKNPLAAKRQTIVSDLNILQSQVPASKRKTETWTGLFSNAPFEDKRKRYFGVEAKLHEEAAKHLQQKIAGKQSELRSIDAEMSRINRELSEISTAKLTP